MLSIQVLRALAVYLVVLVHLLALVALADGPKEIFYFGNAGVDLFFVISGLIMVFTTSRRESRPWDFFAHRIARVVPLYWLITLFVFSIAFFSPNLLQSTQANLVHLAKSLLFIPFQKDNGLIQPVVFVGWTLIYEMFFYAIFAASLFLKPRLLSVGATVAVLFGLVIFHYLSLSKSASLEVDFFTNPILLEFAMGMMLGLSLPYVPKQISSRWPVYLLICVICAALGLFVLVPMLWPSLDRALIFGLPSFAIVLSAVALDQSRVKWPSMLVLLGDASYSIYLTHFFVTQTCVKLAERLQIKSGIFLVVMFLIALVGVGIVGVLTHLFIEKPLTNVARRLLGLTTRGSTTRVLPAPIPGIIA
jgi:exopolysaccharide production protein ExoZ